MIRFVIRFDDPSATSRHAVEARVTEELLARNIPITFAVVALRKGQSYDFDRDDGDPLGKVYSYEAFGELLDCLIDQQDIWLQNLQQIAKSISGKPQRWHRHDKWCSRLPWRFRHWLPTTCFITRTYRFPSNSVVPH